MEIQPQFILILCVVNSGLVSLQTDEQTRKQAVISLQNDGEIRENFQNLLDSLAAKDHKKSKFYHELLMKEVSKGQHAFDVAKKRLRSERTRNSNQRDPTSGKNIIAIKRATKKVKTFQDIDFENITVLAANGTRYIDIFEAAESDDEMAVRSYIDEHNVPANVIDNHQLTAAHIAARKGVLNIVKYVLEKDLSILDQYRGEEVFVLAIKYGHLHIVKYLVEHVNMSIEKRSTNRFYGNTAIHFAAQWDEMPLLKYFLEERNGDVNVLNDVQQTPLFEAVECRNHPIIKYLIEERGADVNKIDYMSDTIMDKAVKKEDYVILKYFIKERKMKVTIKWRNEKTHLGASFGGLSLLKFLVDELNPDLNAPDPWGHTPLHMAAKDNNYDVCKFLLDHGANPKLRDMHGIAPVEETEWENITALLTEAMTTYTERIEVPH